jgi:hypothetical protein
LRLIFQGSTPTVRARPWTARDLATLVGCAPRHVVKALLALGWRCRGRFDAAYWEAPLTAADWNTLRIWHPGGRLQEGIRSLNLPFPAPKDCRRESIDWRD